MGSRKNMTLDIGLGLHTLKQREVALLVLLCVNN